MTHITCRQKHDIRPHDLASSLIIAVAALEERLHRLPRSHAVSQPGKEAYQIHFRGHNLLIAILVIQMMKIIEKRGGGKKRNRGEGQVGASLGNNEEQTAVAVENSCNDDISGDSDSPLYKHAGRAQAAPTCTDGTYGAVAADIHLEMGEEYELSDASSQYSTKMGILTAEDLKAGTDVERYLRQDPLGRAFPERTLALLVSSSQFIC